MSGGFKDIIKKEHIENLEKAFFALDHATGREVNKLKAELKKREEAEEFIYNAFIAHTWHGRFNRLVKWLGNKPGSHLRRSLKTFIAGAWSRVTRRPASSSSSTVATQRKSSTPLTKLRENNIKSKTFLTTSKERFSFRFAFEAIRWYNYVKY